MKQCKDCNETKSLDLFPKQKTTKDGYENTCKSCRKEYKRKYNAKNKTKHFSVYLLPDHNYVGKTNNMVNRMEHHRSRHSRNTDNVRILYTTKSKSDALELEALLHDIGYEGRNRHYTRRKY